MELKLTPYFLPILTSALKDCIIPLWRKFVTDKNIIGAYVKGTYYFFFTERSHDNLYSGYVYSTRSN